jgi:hypothetical protein
VTAAAESAVVSSELTSMPVQIHPNIAQHQLTPATEMIHIYNVKIWHIVEENPKEIMSYLTSLMSITWEAFFRHLDAFSI